MKLFSKSSFLRLSAVVLLGSIGVGVASPVLAAGDIADRLSAEGISKEALDAALNAAESGSPAEVAEAVTTAIGSEALASKAVLHALYGQLYQLLQFQQGPKAVSGASVATSQLPSSSHNGIATESNLDSRLIVHDAIKEYSSDVPTSLPRVDYPAVQPLGP